MKSNYFEIEGFESIFLEDSFILEIVEEFHSLKFLIDIVLTENHPLYTTPKNNEAYCYKKGEIIFADVKEVNWIEKKMTPSVDLDGEIDFGNIDLFFQENNSYHLLGDWGDIVIRSAKPKIKFAEGKD